MYKYIVIYTQLMQYILYTVLYSTYYVDKFAAL